MAVRNPTTPERFWSKVRVRGLDQCWIWRGAKDRDGYGRVVGTGAHRFVWYHTRGVVPRSELVLHRCDTPACVNPCHLFSGTNKDNSDDKIRKGRGRWVRGIRHYAARITPTHVRAIRLAAALGASNADIAHVFHLTPQCAYKVVNRLSWKHVP